jgi:hypothetical protein
VGIAARGRHRTAPRGRNKRAGDAQVLSPAACVACGRARKESAGCRSEAARAGPRPPAPPLRSGWLVVSPRPTWARCPRCRGPAAL